LYRRVKIENKITGETVEKDEFECRVLLRTSFF
jgi:hypothetical protein